MNTHERFQKMKIDFACLGIHYCTIPEFGEMIFAVSPMNFGDCVHPIAKNFEDLLRLLLSCADMAILEQCYAWDEEEYKTWLIDCPATKEQAQALAAIQEEFGLGPMEDAFAYVKQLPSVSSVVPTVLLLSLLAALPARPVSLILSIGLLLSYIRNLNPTADGFDVTNLIARLVHGDDYWNRESLTSGVTATWVVFGALFCVDKSIDVIYIWANK